MSKRVFMLVYDIDVYKGGLVSAMLSRSKALTNLYGYDVDLVTLDYKSNYKEISEELRKTGRLSSQVEILNVYEYYKMENNEDTLDEQQAEDYRQKAELNEAGYYIQDDEYNTKKYARYFKDGIYVKYKKWSRNGSLSHIDYFNENRCRILREEFHPMGYITRKIYFDINNNKPKQELLFTEDGFCYLNKWLNSKEGNIQYIYLFNRQTKTVSKFTSHKDFHVHWLNELCKKQKEKPFLICDGVGSAPKVLEMDKNSAYRIYCFHSNHFEAPHKPGSTIRETKRPVLEKLSSIEALVILTESQKDDITRQFGDFNNAYVIPNFITPMPKVEIKKEPCLAVMIARYNDEKRIDHAIIAFERVVRKLPKAKLEIYGHGEERKNLEELVEDLSLENNVFLKDYTTNVPEVLSRANLTLLTSRFEGLSVVSLESMAMQVPVVSYNVNYGMEDIIMNGRSGYLVPEGNKEKLAECIFDLLVHPFKGERMGGSARKFVLNNYSPEIVCEKWVELFDALERK